MIEDIAGRKLEKGDKIAMFLPAGQYVAVIDEIATNELTAKRGEPMVKAIRLSVLSVHVAPLQQIKIGEFVLVEKAAQPGAVTEEQGSKPSLVSER